jgi:peptidyl-prolyl cis-trans isomerase D
MMEIIRNGAKSWIVKVLIIAPLVLAFAIWGIEDMLRGFSAGSIAKVGDREIEAQRFQTNYNLQLAMISQRYRQRLTPQQANALGIPNQVLSRMINAAAIEQHGQKLGLAVSDEALARDIQRDPIFQDSSGNFDRNQFMGLLYQSDMNEGQYVLDRRASTIRDHITLSMLESVHVPKALVELTNRYENETRKVRYLVLPKAKPETVAAPDEKTLTDFYEARKTSFRTPEFRKITLLQITADDVRKTLNIPETELRQLYESQKSSYETPERRRIQQIAFQDKEKAAAAAKEIAEGKDFLEVAKATGAKDKDINLGVLSQREMIDPKIAEAAFKLEKDKVSEPIEGQFTTVLLRVTEITPGATRSFEEVKDQVRTQLVNQRLGTEIQRLHDLVDEARLAGKSAKDIANELKVSFREIPAISRDGRGEDGEAILTGPDTANIMQTAFEAIVGVENEVVERRDGGYAWIDLQGTTEAKQREFADVKDEVLAAWRSRQVEDQIREKAQAFVDRLGKGETLDALAKDAGVEIKTTDAFKRNDRPEGIPQSVVAQAFTLSKGGGSAAPTPENDGRIVFEVADVIAAPALTDETREELETRLLRSRQTDVLSEYVQKLRNELTVTVNQQAVNRLLGITEPDA